MATEKLFYEDPHLQTFTAVVLSCRQGKHGWEIELDRTAFYPEGGGQPGDRGALNGVPVTDTHESEGRLLHYCECPLEEGSTVEGIVDWQWRFDLMQQHSGEHMVSGLVHEKYGYDNVGFHMGKDVVTIDFSGMLTMEQMQEIEQEVNRRIWLNLPVRVFYPDRETLATLPYRSKKELTGQVRLVEYPDTDLCACCGVHVTHTGEIGLVKLLTCQKFHEGVRVEMLCGRKAVEYLSAMAAQNRQISGLLSAKPGETAAAAARMQQELADARYRAGQLEDQIFAQKAAALTGAGDVLLFEEGLKPDGLRRLADAVLHTCGGRCAVFSPSEDGFFYALGQENGDLRDLVRAMNTALNGRGGGKPFFAQGSVRATRREIEAFFAG